MAQFSRTSGQRFYKKVFLLSVEGSKTEGDYFSIFNSRYVQVKCLSHRTETSPKQVLSRMRAAIASHQLRAGDAAWLVIDRDEWSEADIEACQKWANDDSELKGIVKGLALSNPKFEFWLLLHFESGKEHQGAKACVEALKQYLPAYDKTLSRGDITREQVSTAIANAKELWGTEDVKVWPKEPGKTNVFALCEAILTAEKDERTKELAAYGIENM